jgi:hypothetical protein
MGVAGEVGEDLIGPGKRRLAVHDPALGGRAREPVVRVVIVARGDLGAIDGRLELGQERAAEDCGEDPHGQEEVGAGGDPVGVPRVETPAGDNAVDMRVEQQQLRPGVEDRGDGDLGAQAAEGNLLQGFGDRGEEQGVRRLGGGQEEGVQFGGDGEDDMEVRDGQEVPPLGVHPARGLQPLAFGAMPIPTGVVGDLLNGRTGHTRADARRAPPCGTR